MENLGWDNPHIWTNQYYYANFSDHYSGGTSNYSNIINEFPLLNSSSLLDVLHGDSNIINIPADADDSIIDHSSDPAGRDNFQQGHDHQEGLMRFADIDVSPQLLSLPAAPTTINIIPGLESNFNNFNSLQADGISVRLPNLSNFSSSGESEAISQAAGSPYNNNNNAYNHEYSRRRHGTKRKLEQYSSNFLPTMTSGRSGFQIFFDSERTVVGGKKSRSIITENINIVDFRRQDPDENKLGSMSYEPDTEAIAQVKEMIYRAAAMRPVQDLISSNPDHEVGTTSTEEKQPKRRKNVRISSDPQTVAARHRRERISERLRVLQKLVPGGSKMDTASMLDEAANYLKFLKTQVTALETLGGGGERGGGTFTMHQLN